MISNVGILDQVTQEFLTTLTKDGHAIQVAAGHLFYYLVIIQLALTALWMTIAGESLQNFFSRIVQLCVSFGFFYTLIQLGGQWLPDILNGFIQLGQTGGVQSIDPSSIIDQGASISGAIFKAFFGWGLLDHPFVSLVGGVVCIAILILYALMAAELTIVLVKSYLVVSLGGLFFAFGASDFTQAMSKKFFNAVIGLGLNLMSLYLLLGVGENIGAQWASMTEQAAAQNQLMPMLIILAAVIVYYMILKNVPQFIAGLSGVGGFRNYGEAAVGSAINAGTSGMNLMLNASSKVGGAARGLTQTTMAGHKVAQSMQHAFGQHSGNPVKGISSALSTAAKHTGSAVCNTVKDLATQENRHQTTGQKFNHHLSNQLQHLTKNKGESDVSPK